MSCTKQYLFLYVFVLTTLMFLGCSYKSQNIKFENKTISANNKLSNFEKNQAKNNDSKLMIRKVNIFTPKHRKEIFSKLLENKRKEEEYLGQFEKLDKVKQIQNERNQ